MSKEYKNLENRVKFKKGNKSAEKWTEEIALELGEEMIEWLNEVNDQGEDKGNMFFREFLVIKKGLYTTVINHLMNKFPSFSNLMDTAKEIQEIKLVKYGVADRLNATMTKFVLTNNHGYSEKSENINTNTHSLASLLTSDEDE